MNKPTITHLTHEYGTPSLCGAIRETNPTNSTEDAPDVTCKRCLAKLDHLTAKAIDQNPVQDDDGFPDPPAGDTPAVSLPKSSDLKAKAKAAAGSAGTPKVTKASKPKNTHMADTTNERTGTLCNIPASTPGQTTTDPDAVTCKVCLAKLHGTKPLNAISDEVKAARKAFRSFIARATYMAYMDSDQLGTSWTLCHTNLAGERYQITSPGCKDGVYLCNNTMAGNTKQSLLDTIAELGWSCGEE